MHRSLAAVTVIVAVSAAACNRSAAVDLTTPEARGSYAQGVMVGEGGQDLPMDVEAFMAGVRAGITGSSELTPQERQQALMEFRTIVMADLNRRGDEALAAGKTFLTGNAAREGVMTTASGLQYEVLREGDGPRPAPDDIVVVNYRGQTLDGEVFDDSYERGEPATFPVNQVIPGFSEGLQLMTPGSHYKFYIPGSIGYGMNPPPGGEIGPNDTLVFEVELIRID